MKHIFKFRMFIYDVIQKFTINKKENVNCEYII